MFSRVWNTSIGSKVKLKKYRSFCKGDDDVKSVYFSFLASADRGRNCSQDKDMVGGKSRIFDEN